jgi:hypothetical protein
MKALISPNENNRIAQVEAQDFPVAEPLHWVDCPETVTPEWTYVDGQFVAPVIPEPVVMPEPTAADLMAELAALTAKIQALGA